MTAGEWIELVQAFGAMVAAAASSLWGTRSVLRRLTSYVTVEEYRVGKAALHNEINELRVKLAVYEDRQLRGQGGGES